jgi:hypothetical protein
MSAYYELRTSDERENNYVTLQDNRYGAPSVFQSYIPYFCRACRRVNPKAVFQSKDGFEAGPQIRVKTGREFVQSDDGFFLIKTRVLRLLKRHRVTGYAARPIPSTDWHVLRITRTVPFKKFKPKYDPTWPACKACGGRPYYGIAEALQQIGVPTEDNTFFTPELERAGQDIYLTEKVALMLKANHAKGASLDRLLDDDEYKLACLDTAAARRKIKNRTIYL